MINKMDLARILISSALILSLTACGSSESTPFVCDVPGCTLTSQSTLDGVVFSNGSAVADASTLPSVGDHDSSSPGLASRQFYSFDISSIPATATVTSATLRLFQATVLGQPYTVLGTVIVDHVNYGPSLDGGDYNTAVIAGLGTLSNDATLVYKQLDVTSRVLNDIANMRTRSQYRLKFSPSETNNDVTDDLVAFTDGELSCCTPPNIQPPQLVLTLN